MVTMPNTATLDASFRDPSGFLFTREGVLYRQVNQIYAEDYTRLMDSGLYAKLVKAGLLIAHAESGDGQAFQPADASIAFKTLRPERIAFISYPYEWSFRRIERRGTGNFIDPEARSEIGNVA